MRHVTLTCIHHPKLRWYCKEVAVDKDGRYNGARNIFFDGSLDDPNTIRTNTKEVECKCKSSDLRFAPEELEYQKTHPLETY